ncbi:MAG TPA: SDR family NAD(P)-dependent oxidoreductase [Burkholderiaceae bacterium]|nr:SDR family NAD(P)-dependent oxidoreductase [Burkholderiaceae bacterium]
MATANANTISFDSLRNQLVLVTGAGQGNGRAIALGFAGASARVIVTDVRADLAETTAADIRSAGGTAWAFALDVSNVEACRDLARRVGAEIGPVNVLVNNAGIIVREGIDSPRAAENWRRVLDVNLNGSFNVVHAWLPALRETKGNVVNLASIASFVGIAGQLGYSPSKGGVRLLTQTLARELAADGIRVNAIAPGVIETPMTEATRGDPARLAGFMQRTPLGRVGQPGELVGPVLFLASSLASYITGVVLPVDGGFLS